MVKNFPQRPIAGGTANGARPIRYNYWRTGYGASIFPNLDFFVVQAGEYHSKANYRTGNFEHTEHTQFFYQLKGQATLEYANQRQPLTSGDIFYVPAQHTFTYSSSQKIEYHWLALQGQWPQFLGHPQIRLLSSPKESELEDMFVEIREILILRKPGYPLRAIGVFYELMARLEEISGLAPNPESIYPEAVRNALIYLRENYAEPFNAAQTASAVGLSSSHLRALFEKWLGESPKRFHTRCRINQAKRLFNEQDLRVAEVGFHVGFDDVHHFSRVFKQMTGLSPSQYAGRKHPHRP